MARRAELVPNEMAGITGFDPSLDIGAVNTNSRGSHTFTWNNGINIVSLDNMLSNIGVQSPAEAAAKVRASAGVMRN